MAFCVRETKSQSPYSGPQGPLPPASVSSTPPTAFLLLSPSLRAMKTCVVPWKHQPCSCLRVFALAFPLPGMLIPRSLFGSLLTSFRTMLYGISHMHAPRHQSPFSSLALFFFTAFNHHWKHYVFSCLLVFIHLSYQIINYRKAKTLSLVHCYAFSFWHSTWPVVDVINELLNEWDQAAGI